MAQNASCVDRRKFKEALHTVQTALSSEVRQHLYTPLSVTYEAIIESAKLSKNVKFVAEWCKYVERTLVERVENIKQTGPQVKLAVFCWVCQHLPIKTVNSARLRSVYGVADQGFADLVNVLELTCEDAVGLIEEALKGLRERRVILPPGSSVSPVKNVPIFSPSPSPSKPPAKSPSKSAMKLRALEDTPTKTPSHKRKVAFSEDMDVDEDMPETPSKRPKMFPSTKSGHVLDLNPLVGPPLPSPTKHSTSEAAAAASASPAQKSLTDIPLAVEDSPEREVMSLRIASASTSTVKNTLPSTPRRSRRFVTKEADVVEEIESHSAHDVAATSPLPDELGSKRPRRYRPILSDHKQWMQGDQKVAREWAKIEIAVHTVPPTT
ncbi:hypothetical protein CERSUDRAFT_92402 [Gelatoporia subvermispora B]|uniref:Uncharacterized protein n=1 Tax=Ceriporiopsis subvermispora (strain B) TaxID=914234 RepID=M2QSC1_CERS8|nr:hypothetical protein CERSUDRAFT_92402 [Gelatoporia subvermispora B]